MSSGEQPPAARSRLAILNPGAALSLGANPFGMEVANLALWRALARHGGYQRIDILTLAPTRTADMAESLFEGRPPVTEITADILRSFNVAADAGTLMRGKADISDLAWMRRRNASDRAYSLVGLIHTVAPPRLREMIAMTAVAPIHPWDALICTSPSVRENLERLFVDWGEHLAARTGGRPPEHPALPLIPLGVDGEAIAASADRPGVRAKVRAQFGVAEDGILILWVGRLSFFEKAFPQPMLKAVQQAKTVTGAAVTFIMAGWFPQAEHRELYEQAAHVHAPEATTHFVDGNDQALLADLWAGADIFLSLVDNVQETFGITPLEAMAAGVPVVASDWDGYRYTMRDGVEAFLIPTLSGPAGGGVGARLVEQHLLETITYQRYVGTVAQHTAVHIGRAAAALAELIRNPDLRRRMGVAGRARIREMFDWPVVARQIHNLTDELSEVRARAADPVAMPRLNPAKGDPFRDLGHFATHGLTHQTRLRVVDGMAAADVRDSARVTLDVQFSDVRASPEVCADAFAFIEAQGRPTVEEVLLAFPVPQRRALEMGLAWMAKYGFVDWLT